MLEDGMDYSWYRNEFGNFAERHEKGKGPHSGGRPFLLLVLFFPSFFPAALAGQSFLHTPLFAGFQVKGVALHFPDDVLLLHLALEAAQGVLKRFSLLQSDFRQCNHTPKPAPFGPDSYCKVRCTKSRIICEIIPLGNRRASGSNSLMTEPKVSASQI
jgi:hypothetical protein